MKTLTCVTLIIIAALLLTNAYGSSIPAIFDEENRYNVNFIPPKEQKEAQHLEGE